MHTPTLLLLQTERVLDIHISAGTPAQPKPERMMLGKMGFRGQWEPPKSHQLPVKEGVERVDT